MNLHSQSKEIISVVLILLVSIATAFIKDQPLWWIPFIIAGIVQIILLFFPSIEELHFKKDMHHMEKMKELERDLEEQRKVIECSQELRKIQEKAKKSKEKLSKREYTGFIDTSQLDISLNNFRKRRK